MMPVRKWVDGYIVGERSRAMAKSGVRIRKNNDR
jgi:hypothetical protein